MIKIYDFDYFGGDADARFEVDTEKFTAEHARLTLDFFTWDHKPDPDNDPVDEVMKKYAMEALRIASANRYNAFGVIEEWKHIEGFCNIDGSMGVKLVRISGYELDEDSLQVEITEKEVKDGQ